MDAKEWIESILLSGGHPRGIAGGRAGFVVEAREDGGADVRWVAGTDAPTDPAAARRFLDECAATLDEGGVRFTRAEGDGQPYIRCAEEPAHGG